MSAPLLTLSLEPSSDVETSDNFPRNNAGSLQNLPILNILERVILFCVYYKCIQMHPTVHVTGSHPVCRPGLLDHSMHRKTLPQVPNFATLLV